jgi:glycosyltransferase involved in cell wall biosynthesis
VIRYSIIIPHKNRPELVQKLVQCIPVRDDIEVFLIDDASEDAVLKKIEQITAQLGNLKLILNPDATSYGGGWARNMGLRVARGEYVLFGDSDDMFAPNAFTLLDELLYEQKKEADLFLFNAASVNEQGSRSSRNDFRTFLVNKALREQGKESASVVLIRKILTRIDPPWAKVFKRSFLEKHNIRFDKTRYSNDVLFNAKAALLADNIHVSGNVIYHCLDHPNSLVKEETIKSIKERFKVSVRFNQFIDQFPEMKNFKTISGGFIWACRSMGFFFMLDMLRKAQKENIPTTYPAIRYFICYYQSLKGVDEQEIHWYLISGEKE